MHSSKRSNMKRIRVREVAEKRPTSPDGFAATLPARGGKFGAYHEQKQTSVNAGAWFPFPCGKGLGVRSDALLAALEHQTDSRS